MSRQDLTAASHLLTRALALVPDGEVDVPLEIDLAWALFSLGRPEEAHKALRRAAERAEATGNRTGELCARLEASAFKLYIEQQDAAAELDAVIAEALPEIEAGGDDYALHILYFVRSLAAHLRSQMDEEIVALEQVMFHAQRTDMPHLVAWFVTGGVAARFYGSTPLPEMVAWIEGREAQFGRDWRMTAWRAMVSALQGRFNEARLLQAEFHLAQEERGNVLELGSNLSQNSVALELLAGDPAAAAAFAERGCRILEDAGERAWLSTGACWYALALYELGRFDEAEDWARKGLELGDSEDVITQTLARQALAKVLARRRQHAEGESLARQAIALADATDALLFQGDARQDLAEVLELAGRSEDATAALREALERYERKGALVQVERVRERLAALEPASA
jgi:tetratricopeptide (TPR) repeat protein